MGTLRTIFALSVYFTHALPGGAVLVGGQYAVQLFYVISGFLISYVLVEKKAYPQVRGFYINRYLRLYPIYVVVAGMTLAVLLAAHHASFLEVYHQAPLAARLLLAFSNLFIVGQDWIMFLGVHAQQLGFVTDFRNSDVLLFEGLVIHQTWTLGVELSFYLIAPFVLPRRKLMWALLGLSVALRIALLYSGLGYKDPWTYRFFPTELALFLAGSLSHQILLPQYRRLAPAVRGRLAAGATGLIAVVVIAFYGVHLPEALRATVLFGSFILLVPLTFLFQNSHRLDAWIGNLSYPVYVSHILVFRIASTLLGRFGITDPWALALIGLVFVLLFAALLDRFVAQPFEGIRRHFRRRNEATPLDESRPLPAG